MRAWNLGLIERAFADAAVDSSQWNAAMETVSDVTQGAGALLFPIGNNQRKTDLPTLPHSVAMIGPLETYVDGDWAAHDERYRSYPMLTHSRSVTEFDFTTLEEIAHHPYYQEFLAPHGLRWFAGVLVAAGEDQWCLSIQRSIKQGPFLRHELKRFANLSKRLDSAAAMARAIGFGAANVALAAYELSKTAIVLFNRKGEVIQLNGEAERTLDADLQIKKKRLISRQRSATDALDRALQGLIRGNNESALMPPVRMPRGGRLPLLAYPMKLSPVSANIFAECQALVVLTDPEKRSLPPETPLRTAFSLTAAEARLASILATGQSIESASDTLGIAKDTVRNQLKSIFAKTGTHRQAELVAVIASALGQLF